MSHLYIAIQKNREKSPENHIQLCVHSLLQEAFAPVMEDPDWSFTLRRGQETGQFEQSHFLKSRAMNFLVTGKTHNVLLENFGKFCIMM